MRMGEKLRRLNRLSLVQEVEDPSVDESINFHCSARTLYCMVMVYLEAGKTETAVYSFVISTVGRKILLHYYE
jgi:hypothetical protein